MPVNKLNVHNRKVAFQWWKKIFLEALLHKEKPGQESFLLHIDFLRYYFSNISTQTHTSFRCLFNFLSNRLALGSYKKSCVSSQRLCMFECVWQLFLCLYVCVCTCEYWRADLTRVYLLCACVNMSTVLLRVCVCVLQAVTAGLTDSLSLCISMSLRTVLVYQLNFCVRVRSQWSEVLLSDCLNDSKSSKLTLEASDTRCTASN